VERIREYAEMPHEAPLVVAANRPSPEWPQHGRIQFVNLKLRYISIYMNVIIILFDEPMNQLSQIVIDLN
jgi:hypothetical protein